MLIDGRAKIIQFAEYDESQEWVDFFI